MAQAMRTIYGEHVIPSNPRASEHAGERSQFPAENRDAGRLVQLQPPAPTLNLRIKPRCTKEDGAIPGVGGRQGSDNIV